MELTLKVLNFFFKDQKKGGEEGKDDDDIESMTGAGGRAVRMMRGCYSREGEEDKGG